MSLATQGGALILRLSALAVDCLCCLLCRGEECQANSDCSEGCSCVRGRCLSNCLTDEDCPEGYICVNGSCVPRCQGESCLASVDCGFGCSCADFQCWPNSDLYFCVWASAPRVQVDPNCDPAAGDCETRLLTRQEIFDCENDPACKDTLPERNCQRGKPEDDDLIHDGPFLTYTECCGRSCKCLYRCQADTACTPWPTGEYEDENECNAGCGSPEDVGACCETRRLRDENDDVYRYERGPAPDPCPRSRSTCVSEEDIKRDFRPTVTDCGLCPSTLVGACCTEDGCVDTSSADPLEPIDRFECEQVLGGEFRNTWVDCRQPRDPSITAEFACDDCNGRFDCDCDVPDHCVNRRCVPCLDQVVEIPVVAAPGWHDTGIPVAAGATVTLIAKQCDDLEWGTTIRSQVGEGLLQTGGPDDEYVADQAGNLRVRLERQGQPATGQACVQVTDPPPPPPADCEADWGDAFVVFDDEGVAVETLIDVPGATDVGVLTSGPGRLVFYWRGGRYPSGFLKSSGQAVLDCRFPPSHQGEGAGVIISVVRCFDDTNANINPRVCSQLWEFTVTIGADGLPETLTPTSLVGDPLCNSDYDCAPELPGAITFRRAPNPLQ